MKERIEFRVNSTLPPKKDGATSMWQKSTEVPRLIALRQRALTALAARLPFRANIAIELELHYVASDRVRAGDLDNFITGICDGLMAADGKSKLDSRWEAPDLEAIHPFKIIAIEDDDAVVAITAKKISGAASPWYKVVLEGE